MQAVDGDLLWRNRPGHARRGRRSQEAAGTFCALAAEEPPCAPLLEEELEEALSAPELLVEGLLDEELDEESDPSEEEVEEAVEAPEVAESVE